MYRLAMKEFGGQAYRDVVYINFDANSRMAELFSSDLTPDRLILGLEVYAGRKIAPPDTLLIFDEIQEVPSLRQQDFLIDNGETVIPVEVKAEINLRAKSLKVYREKFQPEKMVRISMADYREETGLVNLPLYAVGEMGCL